MKYYSRPLRLAAQSVFLGLFLLTVLQATYPFQPWLPPELFLWLDPLASFSTMIADRFFTPVLLLSLLVLLSPLVFGRAFCGWVCPLGTVIDLCDRFIAPHTEINLRRYRPIKSVLLVIFILLAILGIQLAWLLDPLPILWRTIGVPGMALFFLIIDALMSGLGAVGIFPTLFTRLQDQLAGYLFPVARPAFGGLFLPVLIFGIIIGLSKVSRRFWCRTLCPLGALLGLVAKFSPWQRTVDSERCTSCAICQRGCKMEAIEPDIVTTEKSECILCQNCAHECPTDAIWFGFRAPGRMRSPVDLSRRAFIGSGLGALAATGFLAINRPDPRHSDRLIRPPGAIPEKDFNTRCLRCGECVRICATSGKCLQHALGLGGLESILTPLAQFRSGYCEVNCNLCGQICPTKAIRPLALPDKQKTKMGLAIFIKDRCIPYRLNQNCMVCEEHCPVADKAIQTEKRTYHDASTGLTRVVDYPFVIPELCIGCGICENKCPLSGEAGIIVVREGEERLHT